MVKQLDASLDFYGIICGAMHISIAITLPPATQQQFKSRNIAGLKKFIA
jgi:hypothetical protein